MYVPQCSLTGTFDGKLGKGTMKSAFDICSYNKGEETRQMILTKSQNCKVRKRSPSLMQYCVLPHCNIQMIISSDRVYAVSQSNPSHCWNILPY